MAVESEILSLSVITIFAFLKVFLERYLLKPRLEEVGWKVYLKTVNVLKDMTEAFEEEVSLDLDEGLVQLA
jgi:predicted DNA-binding transcriptional regulator